MNFKEKVQNGCNIIGTHVNLIDANITEIFGKFGYDYIWVDLEHTRICMDNLYEHILAARTTGVIFKNKLCISHINVKKIKSIFPIVIFALMFDGISYMLQLIGAESLPASVLYPFITGGSIILTSFAGVAFLKEKLIIRQWMAVTACFVGTLLFL